MAILDNNTFFYLRGDSFLDLSPVPKDISDTTGIQIVDNKISFSSNNGLLLTTTAMLDGDFTIEWWSNPSTIDSLNSVENRVTETCFLFGHRTSNVSYLANWVGAKDNWNVISSHQFGNVTLNVDTHYAYVRSGNKYYAFKNGVLVSTMTGTIAKLGLNGTRIGPLSTQKMWNIRLSTVARWTTNFTPPTEPYDTLEISNVSCDEGIITINVNKVPNEEINKIEILVNEELIETISGNYDDINYDCNEFCAYGLNNIEAKVYYFNNNSCKSKTISYFKSPEINDLSMNSNIVDALNKINEINEATSLLIDYLFDILNNKGVEISESDKRLSYLISKVNELPNKE